MVEDNTADKGLTQDLQTFDGGAEEARNLKMHSKSGHETMLRVLLAYAVIDVYFNLTQETLLTCY